MHSSRMALSHFARARMLRIPRPAAVRSARPATTANRTTRTYIICTNPRSGSWLLSEGLASTSVAGNPREWFNALEEQNRRASWRMEHASELSYARYLALARRLGTSKNGIFGIKLHYYQFLQLPRKVAEIDQLRNLTPSQALRRIYPGARYLWLTRQDKVRQAISFVIAAGTQEWWNIEAPPPIRPEDPRRPEFDPAAIARMEKIFRENDAGWQAFFEESGIQPLVIRYEDLASDYANQIVSVLKWLDVPGADSIVVPPPRLRRQSDNRNEEWFRRYAAASVQPKASEPATNPLDEEIRKAATTIPDAWKQWMGQSKLLRMPDEAILDVLVKNGFSREVAAAELDKANSDAYLQGAMRARQNLRGVSILNALGKLAQLNPAAKTVERRSRLSRDEFRDRYYSANRPVILNGLMTDWRALTAWTPEYLKSTAGNQIVEVMTRREADPHYEANSHAHRAEVRFAEYVDRVFSGAITNDYYLVANNRFFEREQAQPLLKDFHAFPEYLTQIDSGRQCHFWFGPAGTVTPLHHDTSNILMAQVIGRKRCRLVPAADWQYVYNREGVFSQVDCENPDLVRFPKFRNASIIDVVLKPGEVLFVPVGWWHHVRALDVSITVSFTNFVFPNHFTWG